MCYLKVEYINSTVQIFNALFEIFMHKSPVYYQNICFCRIFKTDAQFLKIVDT